MSIMPYVHLTQFKLYMAYFYGSPCTFPIIFGRNFNDFFRISKILLYWITIIPPEMNGHAWYKSELPYFGEIKWDKLDPYIVLCTLMSNVVV